MASFLPSKVLPNCFFSFIVIFMCWTCWTGSSVLSGQAVVYSSLRSPIDTLDDIDITIDVVGN